MNQVILMGRLTKDPEIRYTQDGRAIGRYTLAVERRRKNDDEEQADFIQCVTWEKAANFAQKYFRKGQRVLVSGRIQTGKYQNKNNETVYTTDVIVFSQEFADAKREEVSAAAPDDGFMKADPVDEGFLPFN